MSNPRNSKLFSRGVRDNLAGEVTLSCHLDFDFRFTVNSAKLCGQSGSDDMPYVARGEMTGNRSLWRLSIIPEIFWGILNFIQLFFLTLIDPGRTKHGSSYTSEYRTPGGPGGPGGPRRRMGRLGGWGDAPSPPPMGGGG